MASKSVTSDAGRTLRTYSRLQPLQRLQSEPWFSPADPKHLFSSSSSLRSSLSEPSSQSDSEYKPSIRKKRAASNVRKPSGKRHAQKRPAARRKRKISESHRKTPRNLVSEPKVNGSDTENIPVSERNPETSPSPFLRFVTVRRKGPVLCPGKIESSHPAAGKEIQVTSMKAASCFKSILNPKPREKLIPASSPDSTYDFQVCGPRPHGTRILSKDINIILDSSGEIPSSPLQKCPLLSSTPSAALVTKRRKLNRLDLCDQLEESVIMSCVEPAEPSQDVWKKTRPADVYRVTAKERDSSTLSESMPKSRSPSRMCELGEDVSCKAGSASDSLRVEECQKSASCTLSCRPSYFSPVLVSSQDSQSVFCIEEGSQGCHGQEAGSVVCVSLELLSGSESKNVTLEAKEKKPVDLVTPAHTLPTADPRVLADGPCIVSLSGASAAVRTPMDRKSLQPFVRLNAKSVTKYLQRKKTLFVSSPRGTNHMSSPPIQRSPQQPARTGDEPRQSARNKLRHSACDEPRQAEANKQTSLSQSRRVSAVFPDRHMCHENTQPVVLLDSHTVSNYFLGKSHLSLPSVNIERCKTQPEKQPPSPSAQTSTRSPVLLNSWVKNKALSSAGLQDPGGTGRKVCISGFSATRWGTHRKKRTCLAQDLSFQDRAMPTPRYREDSLTCGALSSSVLLSTSLLTSSFMNSSFVMNLSLSPGGDPDPQREHRRWLQLRAALSLHRKKKVELAVISNGHEDEHNLTAVSWTAASQRSSLFLLSPQFLSCEDPTDAEKVYMECDQDRPISFSHCLSTSELFLCQKVGEGVYGEVFKTMRGEKQVALKVIPIEGSEKVNGEEQKSFSEILPEIIISKELSLLNEGGKNNTSGFIKLHSAHCVQGTYPAELLKAWDTYAEIKGTENERPDFFSLKQLFMVLEFEFGGNDLECMSSRLPSVSVSSSILHQVTVALAVAEEELRFEHRDLHWGNLLIEKCESQSLTYSLTGETKTILSSGVQVKIIDYTLSRLDKDGLTVFTDLSSDDELFLGEGDLQFSIYRETRQENKNLWSSYHPFSNVLWLHYLADKLLGSVTYIRKPTSVSQRRELRKIQNFRREVRNYSSATEALKKSRLFK